MVELFREDIHIGDVRDFVSGHLVNQFLADEIPTAVSEEEKLLIGIRSSDAIQQVEILNVSIGSEGDDDRAILGDVIKGTESGFFTIADNPVLIEGQTGSDYLNGCGDSHSTQKSDLRRKENQELAGPLIAGEGVLRKSPAILTVAENPVFREVIGILAGHEREWDVTFVDGGIESKEIISRKSDGLIKGIVDVGGKRDAPSFKEMGAVVFQQITERGGKTKRIHGKEYSFHIPLSIDEEGREPQRKTALKEPSGKRERFKELPGNVVMRVLCCLAFFLSKATLFGERSIKVKEWPFSA